MAFCEVDSGRNCAYFEVSLSSGGDLVMPFASYTATGKVNQTSFKTRRRSASRQVIGSFLLLPASWRSFPVRKGASAPA